MIVNLIKKERIFSIKLPEKINGKYWIKDFDEAGESRELISIEAIEGQWVIKSNKIVYIVGKIMSTLIKPY